MDTVKSFATATPSMKFLIHIYGGLFIIVGLILIIIAATMNINEGYTHGSKYLGTLGITGNECENNRECDGNKICNNGKCEKHRQPQVEYQYQPTYNFNYGRNTAKDTQRNLYIVGGTFVAIGTIMILINHFWKRRLSLKPMPDFSLN